MVHFSYSQYRGIWRQRSPDAVWKDIRHDPHRTGHVLGVYYGDCLHEWINDRQQLEEDHHHHQQARVKRGRKPLGGEYDRQLLEEEIAGNEVQKE